MFAKLHWRQQPWRQAACRKVRVNITMPDLARRGPRMPMVTRWQMARTTRSSTGRGRRTSSRARGPRAWVARALRTGCTCRRS